MRAFCVLMCVVLSLEGATYYVAPSGNDGNPGTEASPWATIQHAANVMVAGDTTIVQAGTYAENVTSVAAGSSGAPITFQASGTVNARSFSLSHPYQNLTGFTLSGVGVSSYSGAVNVTSAADNCVFTGLIITQPNLVYAIRCADGADGLTINGVQVVDGQWHGITIYGTGQLLTNCLFRCTNGWDAIRMFARNSTITHCVWTNWSNLTTNANHTDLIQTFSVQGQVATNNVIEYCRAFNCQGTQLTMMEDQALAGNIGYWTYRNNAWDGVGYAGMFYGHHVRFVNNSFRNCGKNTGNPISFRYSTDKGSGNYGSVTNCVFIDCGIYSSTYGYWGYDSGVVGCVGDYNYVYPVRSTFTEPHGVNGGDAGLVGTGFDVLEIGPNSVCVNRGAAVLSDDILGLARPQGGSHDIGAYEYGSASPPPPPPPPGQVTDLHFVY